MFKPQHVLGVVALMATAFPPALATAQTAGPAPTPTPGAAAAPPDAAARFAEAQALYEKGAFDAALAGFQPLAEATQSPNALLYVARSLRELGRLTEAYDAMQIAVRVATERAVAEEKYAATRDAASGELAILALKVSHVVVAVADAPEGAQVQIDGATIPPAQVGSAITVLPGAHEVELVVPGKPVVKRSVNVAAGESKTVALAGSSGPTAGATPNDAPSRGGELRTAGFIVGGVGAASLVVGVVTGVLSNGKFSDVEDQCGGARCTDPSVADTIDSGKSLETVANVTLIGGLVLVAAAVPMVVFGGPSQPGGAASLSWSPTGGAVRWQTTF